MIMPQVGKEQIHSAIGPMLAKVNGGSEQDVMNKLEQFGEAKLMHAVFFGILFPITLCIINNLVNSIKKSKHSAWHTTFTIVGPIGLIFAQAGVLGLFYGDLIVRKPYLLFVACGLQHVQSLSRLIIASTSKDRYVIIGPEFIGFLVHVACIAAGQKEIGLWLGMCITAVTCTHFVVTVINEITTYLGINCLTITEKKVDKSE